MKKQSKFAFLRQEGQIGYYATVILHVERQSIMEIQYGDSCDPSWESAARFGVSYALGQLAKTEGDVAFRIVIEKVLGHEIDTTDVIVAYAAAHALWDAIESKSEFPIAFHAEHGTFVFPR